MKTATMIAVAALAFATGGFAQAQNATKEDAVALTKKAAAYLQKNGVEAACKTFADPQGGFMQGELYVFVQDMQAKMVCNAANKKMNGVDLSALKDADGKPFSKEMAELAKGKGYGWVDYQWVNPGTKTLEPKLTYVEKVNDKLFLGVGIYRKHLTGQ